MRDGIDIWHITINPQLQKAIFRNNKMNVSNYSLPVTNGVPQESIFDMIFFIVIFSTNRLFQTFKNYLYIQYHYTNHRKYQLNPNLLA